MIRNSQLSTEGSRHCHLAQVLADVTRDAGYAWKRRALTAAYVVYGLSLFLQETKFCQLTWPSDVFSGSAMDNFLLSMRKSLTSLLTVRWGVEHKCKCCEGGFLLGVDGKHGARRYTCAWKDVGVEEIESLGGIAIRRPCSNRAVLGSIFCSQHAQKAARDCKEATAEEEEEQSAVTVLRCRRGAPHRASLTEDAAEPEYEVKIVQPDGHEETVWRKSSEISPVLLMAFEESCAVARAHQSEDRVRKHKGFATQGTASQHAAFEPDEVDAEENCGIEKQKQHKKRKSTGGIVALVTSCQLFVGWRCYMEGEGLADVYVALAEVMEVLLAHERPPLAIFYDNACALRAFVKNPKRAQLSEVAQWLAQCKLLLDVWHRWNHLKAQGACLKDANIAKAIDPYHESNQSLARMYNTEACEQAFSWMDQFCPFLLEMGPGLFVAHVTMMMDRRNRDVVQKREKKEVSCDSCLSAEALRAASSARFRQLRQREIGAERMHCQMCTAASASGSR